MKTHEEIIQEVKEALNTFIRENDSAFTVIELRRILNE